MGEAFGRRLEHWEWEDRTHLLGQSTWQWVKTEKGSLLGPTLDDCVTEQDPPCSS